MAEVTQPWQNGVGTTERERSGWREPAPAASFPRVDPPALQRAARPLRPQDFADTGPPGSRAQQN
jgi:hypothetical protein